MTKKSPNNREQRANAFPGSGPTAAQLAASEAFAPVFEQKLDDLDELLRLQRTAQQIFSTRPPSQFAGFGNLLDAILPRDSERQRRIARAVALDAMLLQRLRSSLVDPLEVPAGPIAALSRFIDMDFNTFWVLAQRDHVRLTPDGVSISSRASGQWAAADAAEQVFRAAWERDARDDISRGDPMDLP